MQWVVTYQYMDTVTGPQWVALGRYEPAPAFRQFPLGAHLDAFDVARGQRFNLYY